MQMSVGDRLARFEIVGALGAGGMGEVYRARDPQLGRDVAIKIMRVGAGDPVHLRRFEREARAAASLSHPNIVEVHDVGIHEATPFIVTELLAGESLRERLREGKALPARLAVDYAVQIASGLAAGHERGIVHRDVKPENVFVTADGRIKILDFGLAKLGDGDAGGDVTQTITVDGVELGPVMGTPNYMSPEQARGLRTDHRSDIFSLGAVLYEMLTGLPPFRRETTTATLSAILHDEPPDLGSVVPVPRVLERIVYHCLEKQPEHRFQSARDLMFDLENVRHPSDPAHEGPATSRSVVWKPRALATVAGLGAVAAAAALGYLSGAREGATTSTASPVYNARRLTDFTGLEEFPALSPDQRSVAFAAHVKGRRQLFVRLLSGGPPLPLTTDDADPEQPRWARDGGSLLYFSPARSGQEQGALWEIPALGGAGRRIASSLGGADVNPSNGRLTFFRRSGPNIELVTSDGDGTGVELVHQFPPVRYYLYPRWSPDGRWIAFQRGDSIRFDIFVVSSDGGEPRQLTRDNVMMGGLASIPDGTAIIYSTSRGETMPYLPTLRLWRVALGDGRLQQITSGDASYMQPDVASTGAVVASRVRLVTDVWRFPADGPPRENVNRAVRITRQTGQVLTPTVGSNGAEIAFLSDSGGHANLWVIDTDTGALRQITYERDPNVAIGVPVWSPDGRSIAFVYTRGNAGLNFGVWLVNPDGSNLRLLANPGIGPAWSHDGRWVYYSTRSADADVSQIVLKKSSADGGTPVTVTTEALRNVIGSHGSTLYYVFERPLADGKPEFEIRAATPDTGPFRVLARISPARVPIWQIVNPALSPDGQWLAQALTDGVTTNVWALSTATAEWRQITDFDDRAVFIARRVSWSPDGSSILAAVGEGDTDVVLLEGLLAPR